MSGGAADRFLAAVGFFTRLPVPARATQGAQSLAGAVRYLPLVGVLVGAVGGAVTLLALRVLPPGLSVTLGMAATVLLTGALHEDGFADACDGFGGGWDKAQVLAIMKDSRLGSYGAIGIVLLLLAKWNALTALPSAALLVALVAGHALSRLMALVPMALLDYARSDDGKAAPLASRPRLPELILPAACGLAPLALLPPPAAAAGLLAAALTALLATRYFSRRIGGYTGDCLGATQQASELAFYIGVLCSFS